VTPPDWINVDGSWNAWLAKRTWLRNALITVGLARKGAENVAWAKDVYIHDIRKPLPWADGTFTAVYTSHTLEHLFFDVGMQMMRESHRVLRPGGVLRVVVPDVEDIINAYVARRRHPHGPHGETRRPGESYIRAHELNERLWFRPRNAPRGNLLRRYYESVTDFHYHKWMWDAESLIAEMQNVGFKNVRRCGPFESAIENIRGIEREDRVEPGGLAVEGTR
jgi:predicted SAM-dependent methyltransferase